MLKMWFDEFVLPSHSTKPSIQEGSHISFNLPSPSMQLFTDVNCTLNSNFISYTNSQV